MKLKNILYWVEHFSYGFAQPKYLNIYSNELFDLYYSKSAFVFEGDYFSYVIKIYRDHLYKINVDKKCLTTVYLPFKYKGVKLKLRDNV